MFLFIMACGSRLSWCRKHVNPVQIIVRTFIYIYIYRVYKADMFFECRSRGRGFE
jgi:hypothetical protein